MKAKTRYKTRPRITKEQPSSELKEMASQDAGMGVSTRLEDCASWLPGDLFLRPWIKALDTIDKTKGLHKDPLLDLLRSEEPIRKDERWYVADLLDIFRFNKPANAATTSALELLRGSTELTRMQRLHLALLIEQRTLKRAPGRPSTLAYQRTAVEAQLEQDAGKVRQLMIYRGKRAKAMDFEPAVDKVAPNTNYAATLKDRMTGRRGSTRRMEKRRPKA